MSGRWKIGGIGRDRKRRETLRRLVGVINFFIDIIGVVGFVRLVGLFVT